MYSLAYLRDSSGGFTEYLGSLDKLIRDKPSQLQIEIKRRIYFLGYVSYFKKRTRIFTLY